MALRTGITSVPVATLGPAPPEHGRGKRRAASPGRDGDGRRVRTVDRLLSVYNLLLAGAWLAVVGAVSAVPRPAALAAGVAAAGHLAAATLPRLFTRIPERPHAVTRLLRETYPLLWLGALWGELDVIIASLHSGSHDAAIRALDLSLFGVHPHRILSAVMPWAWLDEIMHLSYLSYYGLIFLPPLAMLVAGRRDALRDMTLRLMVTYVACYVIYLVHPVVGPRLTDPTVVGTVDGLFRQIVAGAHAVGDSRGTAFPSSHVAGAVTIAVLGCRWFSRPVALLLALQAGAVLLSTVYGGYHYAVDALAGLVLGLGLQLWVVPFLEPRPDRRSALPDVPVLPARTLPGLSG